jgi:hypothetical protein
MSTRATSQTPHGAEWLRARTLLHLWLRPDDLDDVAVCGRIRRRHAWTPMTSDPHDRTCPECAAIADAIVEVRP